MYFFLKGKKRSVLLLGKKIQKGKDWEQKDKGGSFQWPRWEWEEGWDWLHREAVSAGPAGRLPEGQIKEDGVTEKGGVSLGVKGWVLLFETPVESQGKDT